MGAHQLPRVGRVVPLAGALPSHETAAVAGPGPTDWKALCEETRRRLDIAESSLKETRLSADEMRGRMQKYKQRLDSAQSENNKLQARVVELSAKADEQAERIARLDAVKRRVHEFRQSILDGPLWELFVDL